MPTPPKDIDVVTFFYIPDGQTQKSLDREFPVLFDSFATEEQYGVHVYYVPLNQIDRETLIDHSTYWYSVWSHTRGDMQWKGYVQVDLDNSQDTDARAELDRMTTERGVQP